MTLKASIGIPVFTIALVAVAIGYNCGNSGSRSVELNGLLFRFDAAPSQLSVSLTDGADGPAMFPTQSFGYQIREGKQFTLLGDEIDPAIQDRNGTLGYEDIVVIRPGMEIHFSVHKVPGTDFFIKVDDDYSSEVRTYFRRSLVPLWTGEGRLQAEQKSINDHKSKLETKDRCGQKQLGLEWSDLLTCAITGHLSNLLGGSNEP